MIYQYVKRYLKNTLEKPTMDFEWSAVDDASFFSFIQRRYSLEEFAKEIREVKIAFKDFFEPVGNVIFRYKEANGIKFKIFPYRVNPQDSIHLQNIVEIINTNKKCIQYISQGEDEQIVISGKIRREVNKEVFDTKESINVKELIKHAIKSALHLGKRDVITQLKRKYLIKIFNKDTVLDLDEELAIQTRKEGDTNKFNGYTAQEVEETYKKIFEKGNANIKYFLKATMKNAFQGALNFREIDNKFYEVKSLKLIHQLIAKELNDYIQLENDYLLGISSYLMRKHFYKIHELMANELIKCIHEKNINANNFLLFYNGKTIFIDDKKYMIPSLERRDGKQWNNTSLISLCNLWMNTKKRKESYEHKLVDTDMKLDAINDKLAYIQPGKEVQETKIKETKELAKDFNTKHEELEKKFNHLKNSSLNSTEYFLLEKEVATSNAKVVELKNTIAEAKSKLGAIKDANLKIYTKLESLTSERKQLLQDVKSQNLNVDSRSTQVDPIIESVVKVLMERPKLIE